MLSVNLTINGRPVLVVGGGGVGGRKAAAAVAAGATVTVVDPRAEIVTPLAVQHISQAFQPSHLDGVTLAFACATPDVNTAVVAAAKARGVLVCSASDPTSGDFVLPCVVSRGDLTLTVSTHGASPALAKRIAGELLVQYDDAYAEWVRVLGDMRRHVLATVADAGERRRLLEGFADPAWLARIRTAGADVVWAEMMEMFGRTH